MTAAAVLTGTLLGGPTTNPTQPAGLALSGTGAASVTGSPETRAPVISRYLGQGKRSHTMLDDTGGTHRLDRVQERLAAREARAKARALAAKKAAQAERAARREAAAQAAAEAAEAAAREAAEQAALQAALDTPPGTLRDMARQEMLAFGYAPDQWPALDALIAKESGWRVTAQNPSSGAYGLPQALPGSKMASAGADWRTNPRTQVRWMLGYVKIRYGSPKNAWAHSQAHGWY